MTVLIVYATIEGQTGKIARFIREEIDKAGQTTALIDAADDKIDVTFDGVDRVILAAPVHERRHPKTFEVFLAASQQALAARKTLLISVSLSAAFPEFLEDANDYVVEMEMRTGFEPDVEALVAGAVRSGSYDYYESQVLQHIVLRGKNYDAVGRDHEFTDWAALKETLAAFMAD